MISAGVKEVKNNLSRFLVEVKAGKDILITERGMPIARIVKENYGDRSNRAALARLVQRGVIALPSRSIRKSSLQALEIQGKPVSEIVIEDRR